MSFFKLNELLENVITESPVCDRVVIINATKFPIDFRSDWEKENSKYTRPIEVSKPNRIVFDVDKFLDWKQDYEHTVFANWLDQNDRYIDFDETFKIIECVHKINDPADIELIKTNNVLAIKTLKTLLDDIFAIKKDTNIDYEFYVDIDIDKANSQIKVNLKTFYSSEGNFFSIPFIKSLQVNHGILDIELSNIELEFREVNLHDIKSIVISFKDKDGIEHFYDFSQNPLRGRNTFVSKKLFSPL